MSLRNFVFALFVTATALSCADSVDPDDGDLLEIPAQTDRDTQPGGLFHDFIGDLKYDAAGHPQGAEVFKGAERCAPTTGRVGELGIAANIDRDGAGALCTATTRSLGDGTFALNARALMVEPTPYKSDGSSAEGPRGEGAPVLEIAVYEDDREIASRSLTAADFGEDGVERDLAVNFVHRGDGAVTFEVRWTGVASARLSYVEIFRSTPRLVISPPSQTLQTELDPLFEIEMQDPPEDLAFEVECDGVDRTDVLTDLLETGEAEWVDTDFRTLVSAPARSLFAGCDSPSKVRVRAMAGGWEQETSRVTYLAEPIPCDYSSDDADAVRVLISGFEPFPADSERDNSSKEAVEAYVAGPQSDGIAVMRAILPVEYDAAPNLLQDLMARCEPDVIVGFGQGRWAVDVETVAYNRKDTASIAGGVPDNRGVVYGGDPIVEGGPAEWTTGLPVEPILDELDQLGIAAEPSTDPGRYVCNNLFYAIMDVIAQDSDRTGGFVHLPRIPSVGDAERETLRQTVATVVEATADAYLRRTP